MAAALMHLTRLEDLSASVFSLSSGASPTLSCHFMVSWSNCACDGLHERKRRSQSLYVHRSPLKLVSVPSCRPLRRSGAGLPHRSAACVRQGGDGQRSGSRVGGGPTGSGLDGGTWRLATPDISRPMWLSRGGTPPGCHMYAPSSSCNAHWQPSSDGPDALEQGHYLVCWRFPMAEAASQPLASASRSTGASPSARILSIKFLDTKPRWFARRSQPSEQDMGALCEGFRVEGLARDATARLPQELISG